jgi:phthalate 4,5-cis-dihydrodiol dehydrogenase
VITTQPIGRRLRIGIVGFGAAGQAFLPALQAHPDFDWVAVAEPLAEVRERVQRDHGIAAHASLAGLLGDADLDAVYLATPTALHAEQAVQAAVAGRHVLVEKPMATRLDEARRMVDAADRAGVVLQVGHSHSYDAPIARMRELIESGELGKVQMVNTWCFTDWLYRPRRADELDATQGGGVTFRQGAHQFDVIRLLCGDQARSVRAKTFDWDPARRGIGAHIAFIDFEGGAAATAVYNGYGGLSSMDLCFDISEWGLHLPPAQRQRRSAVPQPPEQELQAKQVRARTAISDRAPFHPFFGLTVVSCQRGDIRQSPTGLLVYGADGVREIEVALDRSPRERVLDEFHAAIKGRRVPLHDGRWGLANLELCEAAIESSRSSREVGLREQTARARGG